MEEEMKYLVTCLFLTLLINESSFVFASKKQRFGYSAAEQRLWRKKHNYCSGPHQSPIAIHSRRSIPLNIPAIEFIYYHNLLPSTLKVHNDGHAISLLCPKPENFTQFPFIFGGKLRAEYEFVGLHFHWGDRNNRGSEHVMNDIRYPLEMHMIHRNMKYKTVGDALEQKDGLAVLAFFYQIKETDGVEIDSIVRNLINLDETNDTIELTYTFSLSSLIGTVNTDRFYTYRGSLTTPKCNPVVTWTLFPDTIPISINQIAKFRMLSNGIEGLLLSDNYRYLQPIGNRKVFLRSVSSRFTQLEKVSFSTNEREVTSEGNLSDWFYN